MTGLVQPHGFQRIPEIQKMIPYNFHLVDISGVDTATLKRYLKNNFPINPQWYNRLIMKITIETYVCTQCQKIAQVQSYTFLPESCPPPCKGWINHFWKLLKKEEIEK